MSVIHHRRKPTAGAGNPSARGRCLTRTPVYPHGRGEDRRHPRRRLQATETPPRAWGRPTPFAFCMACDRNTPTGVGKTRFADVVGAGQWKHPHGRGEDPVCFGVSVQYRETPPRAWGRLGAMIAPYAAFGNTPTGVGKTEDRILLLRIFEKHPHGRGEDCAGLAYPTPQRETPPRAWGRPFYQQQLKVGYGNTPTGVGKTPAPRTYWPARQKHPHGRGEDSKFMDVSTIAPETPPRAWGRRMEGIIGCEVYRNTPTGVGKTDVSRSESSQYQKHPHGRGEDCA